MFARAIRSASHFTFPYVGLRRRECGQVYSTIGAFVVVNPAGWALTSAHIVDEILAVQREAEEGLSSAPADDHGVCMAHSEIWAMPGFETTRTRLTQAVVRPVADIAAVKLEPFDASAIAEYPVLRDCARQPISQGTSVCRLGYPFHDIKANWDEDRAEFSLPTGAFPIPSFALDAIVSRFHRVSGEDGQSEATFIATSTPGLRGQSGGPLLDTDGRLCGLQSHTTHLDLGFDAQFSMGDTVVSERQFLNVGAATHADEIRAVLEEAHVEHEVR
jgi:Trypsin-like peptidase domain